MNNALIKRHFEKQSKGGGTGRILLFGEEDRVALADGFALIWVDRQPIYPEKVDIFADRRAFPIVPGDGEKIQKSGQYSNWEESKVDYSHLMPVERIPATFTPWLKETKTGDLMRMFMLANGTVLGANRRYTDMIALDVSEGTGYFWFANDSKSPLIAVEPTGKVVALIMPMYVDRSGDVTTCLCQTTPPALPEPIAEVTADEPETSDAQAEVVAA